MSVTYFRIQQYPVNTIYNDIYNPPPPTHFPQAYFERPIDKELINEALVILAYAIQTPFLSRFNSSFVSSDWRKSDKSELILTKQLWMH